MPAAAAKAALAAGTLALPPGPLGWATIAPEMLAVWHIQRQLVEAAAHVDLGEELGLAGVFVILLMYLLLVSRGIRIGFTHSDDFSKLLASGLSFVLALQTFIVVGGVTRVVPLTGLTTPFLAAGGSSLLANWIIIGLLLRISDSAGGGQRTVTV